MRKQKAAVCLSSRTRETERKVQSRKQKKKTIYSVQPCMSGSSLQTYVLFSARSEATVIACSSASRSSRRLPTHNVARARSTLQHTVIAPVKALRLTIPLLRAAAAAQPLSLHRLFPPTPTPVLIAPCLSALFRWPTRKGREQRAERGEGRGEGQRTQERARERASG